MREGTWAAEHGASLAPPGQEISKRLQTLLFPRAMVPNHDSPTLPPSFGGIVAVRMSVVSGQQVAFFFRADEPAPLSSPTLTPRAHNRTLRHIVTGILRERPRAPGRPDRDAPDRAASLPKPPHRLSLEPQLRRLVGPRQRQPGAVRLRIRFRPALDRAKPDRAATPHSTSTPPAAPPRSRNTIATQTAASTPDELSALDADRKNPLALVGGRSPPGTVGDGRHPSRQDLTASLRFYRAAVGRSSVAPSVDNFARNVA